MKKLGAFFLLPLILSCNQRTNPKPTSEKGILDTIPPANNIVKDTTSGNAIEDDATNWLLSIFKCADSKSYCYYVDKEKEICSDRFMEFMMDANEIYGPTNLTEKEIQAAEKQYKQKWEKIYPLYTEETWLFGRGNDDALNIKNVSVNKITDLKYNVFIDYGDGIKTQNEVTLVPNGKQYKIDYCKTEYIK